jgi:hypothetical protein
MKRSLLIVRSAFSILFLCSGFFLNGQEAVFSEDFSGFTTGTHSTPATNDISGALDPKTHIAGWTGSKIYSAGGEIKLGTSEVSGWIETPLINMSGHEGGLYIRFDVCRWPGDDAKIQVYLNGLPLGNEITPTDEFQTAKIAVTSGTVSGKFKFASQAKRFFLDNITIVTGNATSARLPDQVSILPGIFPNPACDFISISNIEDYSRLEISDISGRVVRIIDPLENDRIEVSLDGLSPGLYVIRFKSGRGTFISRFLIKKGTY